MGQKYASQNDVYARLNNTVCRYDGEPVYINVDTGEVTGTIVCNFYHASKRDPAFIQCNTIDPLFDESSPELGYMNHDKQVLYLARVPARMNQQGLSIANVVVFRKGGEKQRNVTILELRSDGFRNMIVNDYRPFDKALNKMMDQRKIKGLAFHKHAALQYIDGNSLGVLYRARLVGMFNPRTERVDLLNHLRDGSYIHLALKTLGVPV